jgi:hypothetical protein
VRVGTKGIQVLIDGASVIDANYGAFSLPPADYELLWVGFGYNTTKDGVPFFLQHWDNFGFDGPSVDDRTVHNYVTRIGGTDYQKAARDAPANFAINIPDDLRPIIAGTTAEAWLVATYQMGDFSELEVAPTDFVSVNDSAKYSLPPPSNNTVPLNNTANSWAIPHTVRIKLGEVTREGGSPLAVGQNNFQFNLQNAGLINVHVEVLYPPGSAPSYTLPSAIHPRPRHTELPRFGPPIRIQRVGSVDIGDDQLMSSPRRVPVVVRGEVPVNLEVGNSSRASWGPQLMNVPVQSVEVWATGGTTGIAQVEVFLRSSDSDNGQGLRVVKLDTAIDAPAPQGRYLLKFDSRSFHNGDYELFAQATTTSGTKSHPSYDSVTVSGDYYSIPIRISN